MGIGRRIRVAREQLSMTRKELAQRIGTSESSVSNYENDISHPKEEILYKLIEALEVDANFLFHDVVNASGSKATSQASASEVIRDRFLEKAGREPTNDELIRINDFIDTYIKGVDK